MSKAASRDNGFKGEGKVNVVLLGTGGREHAIALKLRESKRLGTLFVQPDANAGILKLGKPIDVPIGIREIYRLDQFCTRHNVGLVVIGPEAPLAEGYADKLAAPGRHIFGPTTAGARLEFDKSFAKDLMRAASVPTAEARVFTDPDAAAIAIEAMCANEDAAQPLREVMERFESAPLRRRVIDTLLRIGYALLDRGPLASADMTAARELLGPRGGPSAPETLVRDQALGLARLYRAPLPDLPVIKASGLAAGKGVIVPSTIGEALAAVDSIMRKRVFGDAGSKLIVEERLQGREVSVLAITDGRSILVLPPCQDHKRLKDGDEGPNTGGMGAFCPSDAIDEEMMARVERDILVPILDVMRREDIEYKGVLYAGLMLTHAGPKVLEFNCRFGDPECQPLMARLESDLLELMLAACSGRLHEADVRWSSKAACTVVLASDGYPGKPRTGDDITGLDDAEALPDVTVHHAGTKPLPDGSVVTNGGRVLGVTALGDDLDAARRHAYEACDRIAFRGMQLRRDIGKKPEPARRERSTTR